MRPWHLLLVAAALFVPLQAGALDPPPQGLTVSASLDHCGVGSTGIVCKIDASWSGVEGANRYTSTVTLADGSLRDFGTVGSGSGGGSTSLFVPYAGNGIYSVTIIAWGADPEGKDSEIEDAEAETEIENDKGDSKSDKESDKNKETGGEPEDQGPAEEQPLGDVSGDVEGGEGAVIDPGEAIDEASPPAPDDEPPAETPADGPAAERGAADAEPQPGD